MTETGMSLGTPHYMSPEQAMGEREITARSDIYALGCVLYEMLTGEPPFTGPTAQAIVAKVMTETPRPLRPQRKSVPPHVEAAVLTALEKLPADRFESAAAVRRGAGRSRLTPAHPARGRVWFPRMRERLGEPARGSGALLVAIALAAAVSGLACGVGPVAPALSGVPADRAALHYRPARQCRGDRRRRRADLLRTRWLGLRLFLTSRPDVALRGPSRCPYLSSVDAAAWVRSSRRTGDGLASWTAPALVKVPLAGGAPVTHL